MFIDVCIPSNNEEEFISVAEKIETKGLLFLYEKEEKRKMLQELQKKTKIKIYSGLLVSRNTNKPGITFAKAEQQNIENKNLNSSMILRSRKKKTHSITEEAEQTIFMLGYEGKRKSLCF
jgi:hypothetical protein